MAITSLTTTRRAGALLLASDVSREQPIQLCINAWNRAHDLQAQQPGSSNWDCEKAGDKAFLKAVPPLSGYKNICDFIACINYASMIDVIIHKDAAHYLANAKIALSAIYHQPKPAGKRKPGRPAHSRKKPKNN